MRRLELFYHFKKIYPECSRKEIEDLIEAIKGDKYWSVHPEHKDAIYVVALTRAKIPKVGGFQADATYLKKVTISPEAANFSRRGRVLLAVKYGPNYIGKSVITWSAFLRLMNKNPDPIYKLVIEGKIPFFINNKNVSAIIRLSN